MRLVGTATSGIRAQQLALDTIGNNMANANTPGYKANKIVFAEALSTEVRSGNVKTEGNTDAGTIAVGGGVLHHSSRTNFQQGTLSTTDRSLDFGIDGSGFFQIKTLDGKTGYTRSGNFQVDESGQLADMQGNIVQPGIVIPTDAAELDVSSNGEITGTIAGVKEIFGQITLAAFQNPEGLLRNENNLFITTGNSGEPQIGQPGSTTAGGQIFGTIRSKSLELSNVDLATSMTDLIQVQRAYQMNSRLVQDGDKMWGLANTMRR